MSMFRRLAADIFGLLFPPTCPVCGDTLCDGEYFVCTACRFRVPLTGFCAEADNPLKRKLWGLLPVENASAFIWFVEGSDWRRMIHRFKYDGMWRFARSMGEWYGCALRDSGLYDDVDMVVPVPLHWRKRLSRGYNQAEYIADGIASVLGVPVGRHSLIRRVDNPSQTRRSAGERWDNVDGIFAVRDVGALRGKHILLVDDVFTTGATVVSCGEAILKTVEGARLSVAALAASRRGLGIDE